MSGRLVAVAEDVSKSYGDRTVVRDFSARIIRGDRVGIVGHNGAGKTTLLNLLTGKQEPDTGRIKRGTNLLEVALDQRRDSLDPNQTLSQVLTGGAGDTVTVNGQNRHVVSYMKDFLFGPEQANTPVGVLSGGERGRLTLAVAFATPSNLMVLDEPTNDLDLETLELLQERIAEYSGTVLLVSHDRDFLDRVVTSTIATEGDGRWIEYAGGYSDMLLQRGPAKATAGVSGGRSRGTREDSISKPVSKKLSFKDKHALETLPNRMADFEREISRLNRVLSDANLYTRNQQKFADTTKALDAATAALAKAEEQWLALELQREALEGV